MSEKTTLRSLKKLDTFRRLEPLIESPNAGIWMRTRRVTEWDGGATILRWVMDKSGSVG